VGSKQELILIDTNVFVIDLRYKRDTNFKLNKSFLSFVAQNGSGFTTIVNLLELCGILSFNLNKDQLLDLWTYFQDRYKITVLPEPNLESDFPSIEINRLFGTLSKKTSFGDALAIAIAEKYLSFVSTMVTWEDEHFRGKFPGKVLTPNAFLAGHN
jgi:predicted nucleic acid-binding protein